MINIGCGIDGMRALDAGSADLVLTDVPSGRTRAEFDNCPDWNSFFDSAWHCLKPSGALVCFVDNIRLAGDFSELPFFRYDRVWHKSISTGFFTASKRPLRSHEFILTFWRNQPTYNPQMIETGKPVHAATRKPGNRLNYGPDMKETRSRAGATDRFPGSVVFANSVGTTSPDRKHPQQKPVALLESLIKTYTNKGELVVDPFAGSGSTLVAAERADRRSIGFDLNRFDK